MNLLLISQSVLKMINNNEWGIRYGREYLSSLTKKKKKKVFKDAPGNRLETDTNLKYKNLSLAHANILLLKQKKGPQQIRCHF
mmetsp:Transcript_14033/g.12394  ORF Transcript_14033/g.12394 Transcript_14033/m.12394 type:complete len:83 (+) Transcript_14033:42-290(+)